MISRWNSMYTCEIVFKCLANDCDTCKKISNKKFAKFVFYLWLNLPFAWIRMFPAPWKKLIRNINQQMQTYWSAL